LAAPVVLTLVVLLEVAENTHFQRHADGTWELSYGGKSRPRSSATQKALALAKIMTGLAH
jgi:hypothetical protein